MIKVYYSSIASLSTARLDRLMPDLPLWRQEATVSIKRDHDRKLSTAAGLLLVRGLGDIGISPDAVVLKNDHGKPYLRDHANVHFSLSHSGNYAMCTISDSPVGCDVQSVTAARIQVARRFFTAAEQLYLQGTEDPRAMFVQIWTRKESYVKMKGLGIGACPLTSFEVIGDALPSDAIFHELVLPDHHATVCTARCDEIVWEQCKI